MTQAFCCWKVWNVFMLSPISVFTVWRFECANGCKHACECIWANGRDLWYSCKIQPQESGCAYHTKLQYSINLLGTPAAHMSGWSSCFIPFRLYPVDYVRCGLQHSDNLIPLQMKYRLTIQVFVEYLAVLSAHTHTEDTDRHLRSAEQKLFLGES